MSKTRGWSILRTLIVLALGIGLYIPFLQTKDTETTRMTQLAVSNLGIAGLGNTSGYANPVDPKLSEFKAVQTAYESNPSETGSFNVFRHAAKGSQGMITNTELLPTASQAKAVISEMSAAFLAKSVLKSEHTSSESPIAIPSIPGAIAEYIPTAAFSTVPANATNIVIFRYGRVAYLEDYTANSGGQRTAAAFAVKSYDLIRKNEPTFTLIVVNRPIGLTIVYFLFFLILAVFAFAAPTWIDQQRARKIARAEARARYHYRVRGAKVLKGQRSRAGHR